MGRRLDVPEDAFLRATKSHEQELLRELGDDGLVTWQIFQLLYRIAGQTPRERAISQGLRISASVERGPSAKPFSLRGRTFPTAIRLSDDRNSRNPALLALISTTGTLAGVLVADGSHPEIGSANRKIRLLREQLAFVAACGRCCWMVRWPRAIEFRLRRQFCSTRKWGGSPDPRRVLWLGCRTGRPTREPAPRSDCHMLCEPR